MLLGAAPLGFHNGKCSAGAEREIFKGTGGGDRASWAVCQYICIWIGAQLKACLMVL